MTLFDNNLNNKWHYIGHINILYMNNVLIISNISLIKFGICLSLFWSGQPFIEYNIFEFLHYISNHDLPLVIQLYYRAVP